jgi:heat shock protein HslJ
MLFNACGSTNTNSSMKDNTTSIYTLEGVYTITTLDSLSNISQPLTITFDAKTNMVSGFSGCNNYFGNYEIKNNTISFKNMGATKKYCLGNENELESKMMKALNETTNFIVSENKITLLNQTTELLSANKTTDAKMSQEVIKIEYQAHARGIYNMIVLENETISIQDSYNGDILVKSCSSTDWKSITDMALGLDLKGLKNLEAPSKAFQYDGAAIGSFSITKEGNTYKVPTFDAGNPNKEIAPLVEMVLNIAEKSKE